ncbi:MAG: CpsD/CapB family tyrosine-protein kinase [Pseudomonadota bacterium]
MSRRLKSFVCAWVILAAWAGPSCAADDALSMISTPAPTIATPERSMPQPIQAPIKLSPKIRVAKPVPHPPIPAHAHAPVPVIVPDPVVEMPVPIVPPAPALIPVPAPQPVKLQQLSPTKPAPPPPAIVVADKSRGYAYILAGVLAALMMILVARRMFTRVFGTAAVVEQVTGLRCLAVLRRVDFTRHDDRDRYVVQNPLSDSATQIGHVRVSLGDWTGDPAKVVAVTSTQTGEGVSTLATWLALQAAQSGQRALLIDCNLHQPHLQELVTHKAAPTLIDMLTDHARVEEILQRDADTGLYIIPTRAVPHTALDLLQSPLMDKLLAALRTVYDLIILDTPALSVAADARTLCRRADFTLYCVQANRTSRTSVATGLHALKSASKGKIGLVLTQARP